MTHTNAIYRRFSIFTLIVWLFMLVGCGSNDLVDQDQGEPVDLPDIEKRVQLKREWSRQVGNGQGPRYNRLTLGIDDTLICAASANARVICFDHEGKQQWKKKLEQSLIGGVSIGRDHIYVAGIDGVLFALSRDSGEIVWRIDLKGEMLAAPAVFYDRLVVQMFDGRLIALSTEDAKRLWVYKNDVPILTLRGTSSPVAFGRDTVIASFANGKVLALDASNGDVRWGVDVAIAQGASDIERIVDVDASVLLTDRALYAASYQGNVMAVRPDTGTPLWRIKGSTYRNLAHGFDNVYLSNDDSRLIALHDDNGDVRWEQNELLYRELSAPVIFAGYVIVSDYKGYLHIISQVDGALIGRTRVDRAAVRAPMRIDDGQLFVYSDDGKLSAYTLKQ